MAFDPKKNRQPQTKLTAPAAFSRRGSQALELSGTVRVSDMIVTDEQRKRIQSRKGNTLKSNKPDPQVDFPIYSSSNPLDIEDEKGTPWYLLSTEDIIAIEKKRMKAEAAARVSMQKKSASSIRSNSTCTASSLTSNDDDASISNTTISTRNSDRSSNKLCSSSKKAGPASKKSLRRSESDKSCRARRAAPSTSGHCQGVPRRQTSGARSRRKPTEEIIGERFLREKDLDEHLAAVDEEIRRLDAARRQEKGEIARVLAENKKIQQQLNTTREQVACLYDVSLEVLEQSETNMDVVEIQTRRRSAEIAAARKLRLDEEEQRVRDLHAEYTVSFKDAVQSGNTLAKFERIDMLWDKLRQHAWDVGREVLSQRNRDNESQ
mmetsp:Transcript_21600/g.31425  ORF Transcript_21600/g.31425 Transcript_21600/m.31425 type:complete len:378 (+) Transcript_21600:72-1205(+)